MVKCYCHERYSRYMKVMKLHMKVEKIVRGLRAEFHCYKELPLYLPVQI